MLGGKSKRNEDCIHVCRLHRGRLCVLLNEKSVVSSCPSKVDRVPMLDYDHETVERIVDDLATGL